MHLNGFYASLIKFFDSIDSIKTSMIAALIFGFGWSFIYSSQLTFNTANIVFVTFLQGFVLSVIFYALVNVIRILARILIYPDVEDENALPIVIMELELLEKN